VIELNLDLVLAACAGEGTGGAVRGGGERTAGCDHLGRRPCVALDVDSHHEADLEAQENVLVNDQCHRPLRTIATAQLTHELSALDPVAPLRPAARGSDPRPFQRALRPTTIDLADPDTEANLVCSVGDGR
jgi:hypothetical protein